MMQFYLGKIILLVYFSNEGIYCFGIKLWYLIGIKNFPIQAARHTCSDLVIRSCIPWILHNESIKSFHFMRCSFWFQMWPMQTRQQEDLEDTRSSLPLRRYFHPAVVCFGSFWVKFWMFTCWPSCVLQFYACEAVLEEQGIFGGAWASFLSSLCGLVAAISAGNRKCWPLPSHRRDHGRVGFLPSPTWRWHHQSGAARILQRQLPGE